MVGGQISEVRRENREKTGLARRRKGAKGKEIVNGYLLMVNREGKRQWSVVGGQ